MFKSRDEYRAAWDAAEKQAPPVPLNVDIELASVCNLTCPFCFISDSKFDEMIKQPSQDGKSRRRLMDTALALRVIDEAAAIGVPAVKMNWRGESTLHPDYHEILALAARTPNPSAKRCSCHMFGAHPAFHDILVNTNANCKDEAIPGLMAATKVMVSLDSLNPATYAVMRRGGSLDRAKAVIHELIRRGHPNLWIRRVLAKENKHEPFFNQVRAEFGEAVKVSEHFCFDRNTGSSHEAVGCDHDADGGRTYCGYPSQRIVVSSSGLCYPCCIDLHETMPVGDLRHQTLLEVWNGEPMSRLRAGLKAGSYKSEACKNCVSWMSYDAPQRAKVQDIEVKA